MSTDTRKPNVELVIELLDAVPELASEVLEQINRAAIDELNARTRRERQRHALTVREGMRGRLANIKPKKLSGIPGVVTRLSSSSKWCYFLPDEPYRSDWDLKRYGRPSEGGAWKVARSTVRVEA